MWHNLWPARSSDDKSHIILKDGGGVLFALKSKKPELTKKEQNKRKRETCSQAARESPITAGCCINLGLITCVMSSPPCVRAPVTALAALTGRHPPFLRRPLLLHQSARHLIKKLHAPRRSHLIHTVEINPQINVFAGRQRIAGAPNETDWSQPAQSSLKCAASGTARKWK